MSNQDQTPEQPKPPEHRDQERHPETPIRSASNLVMPPEEWLAEWRERNP